MFIFKAEMQKYNIDGTDYKKTLASAKKSLNNTTYAKKEKN
jgi:hypothetical protein